MKKILLLLLLFSTTAHAAGIKTEGDVDFKQIATPSNPASGRDKLYVKSDDNIYRLTSAGVEQIVGNLRGPSSAVDNYVPRWDGTTGRLVQDSLVSIDDDGVLGVGGSEIDFPGRSVWFYTTSADNPVQFNFAGEALDTKFTFWNDDGEVMQWIFASTTDEFKLVGKDSVGRVMIWGDYSARDQNFDHGVQTNPTFYVHSVTEPNTDNTQWVGLTHNQTDAVISSGKGDINLVPAGGDVTVTGAISASNLSGTNTGDQTITLTGDVTGSGTGSFAATIASNQKLSSVGFMIDGGGSTVTTGSKGFIEIPFACTINQVTTLADQSGSVVVDIKKSTYSGFPTTASICASAKPTLSSAQKAQDATLTGWTTSVAAGDVLEFNVDSATTVTRVTVSLKVTKT